MRRLLLILFLMLAAPCFAAPEDDPAMMMIPRLIEGGQCVKARDLAEDFFKRDGGTYASYYLMGLVLKECEGNLQRARYCLMQARAAIAQQDSKVLKIRKLHAEILENLAYVCEEMDQYEDALEALRAHDELVPKSERLTSLYGWPLMKLRRYDEARDKMQEVLKSAITSKDKLNALNTLAAIDQLTGKYQDAYEKALIYVRMASYDSILLGNAGEICLSLQRFEDAERYLISASLKSWPPGVAHAFEFLTMIYTAENRLTDAIRTIKEMHKWEHDKGYKPDDAQQIWAEFRYVSAMLLLVTGHDERALAMTNQMLVRPDRRGNKSMDAGQWEINLLMLHYEALKANSERLAEGMAWTTMRGWMSDMMGRMDISRQMWSTRSRVAALMFGDERVDWTLRPYSTDSLLPEWVRPELGEVLGDGVAMRQVDILLARTDGDGMRERPYLLSVKGNALYRRGAYREAIELLKEAVDKLPTRDVLTRARCHAVMGQSMEALGDMQHATAEYQQVMETFPALIRILGISLPTTIESGDDAASRAAAAALRKSPRFRSGSGFTVRITAAGNGLVGTISGLDNRVLRTVTVDKTDTAAFCTEFSDRAFAPSVDVDPGDVDGTNQSQEGIRKQTDDIMRR